MFPLILIAHFSKQLSLPMSQSQPPFNLATQSTDLSFGSPIRLAIQLGHFKFNFKSRNIIVREFRYFLVILVNLPRIFPLFLKHTLSN